MVCNPLVLALAPLPDAKPSVQRETQAHGKDELTSVLWGQRITITEITFLIRGSQQCLGKPPYIKMLSHLLYSLLQARQSQFSLLSYGERPTWSKSFSFLAVSYKISRLQCPKLDTVFQTAVNQCSAARSNYISGLTHHAPLHPSCVDTAFPYNPGAVVGDKSWPVCALTKSMHSVLRCSALLEIPCFACKWNKHLFLSQFPASFITPPAQQRAPWWWRGCWLLSIKPTGLGFWCFLFRSLTDWCSKGEGNTWIFSLMLRNSRNPEWHSRNSAHWSIWNASISPVKLHLPRGAPTRTGCGVGARCDFHWELISLFLMWDVKISAPSSQLSILIQLHEFLSNKEEF